MRLQLSFEQYSSGSWRWSVDGVVAVFEEEEKNKAIKDGEGNAHWLRSS